MSADLLAFGQFEQATTGAVILDGDEVVLIADCTVQEQHTADADITQYPRERRVAASDHIQPKPLPLKTTLMITSTPLLEEGDPSRPAAAYERLRRLQVEGRSVTIITSLLIYEQMGLESVSTPRSAAQGDAVVLDCSWRQMPTVDTRSVAVPAGILAALTRPSGKDKDKTKDQVAPPGEASTKARKKTAAVALRDAGASGLEALFSD